MIFFVWNHHLHTRKLRRYQIWCLESASPWILRFWVSMKNFRRVVFRWFWHWTKSSLALGFPRPSVLPNPAHPGLQTNRPCKFRNFYQNSYPIVGNCISMAKTCVCCPRPRGNIQREVNQKKRGRRQDSWHWGSWSFVMLGSWVLDRTPSQTLNPTSSTPKCENPGAGSPFKSVVPY